MCFSCLREAARWHDWLWFGVFCMLMTHTPHRQQWEFLERSRVRELARACGGASVCGVSARRMQAIVDLARVGVRRVLIIVLELRFAYCCFLGFKYIFISIFVLILYQYKVDTR